MEDFILPEKYTKDVIEAFASIETGHYYSGFEYQFYLCLTKQVEKKGFFKTKKVIEKEKIDMGRHKSFSRLTSDELENVFEYKRVKSYVSEIRKFIRNKKELAGFDKLIQEGNEAIISPHSFVKDAFILKVVEELKKYNA